MDKENEQIEILYGVLCYNNSYNLGDNIQSLAAIQYLPRIDVWIDRDTGEIFDHKGQHIPWDLLIQTYNNRFKIKVIYNGWFDGQYSKFPPSEFIDPLYISFHINETDHQNDHNYDVLKAHKINFKSIANTNHFVNHKVGCRDMHTLGLLQERGVSSYFSACLTLTLQKEIIFNEGIFGKKINTPRKLNISGRKTSILVVDAHIDCPEIFEKYIPLKMRKDISTKYFTQAIDPKVFKSLPDNSKKIELAIELLKEIASSKLVITSRLHTALPAMAFNIPVIFMHKNLGDVRFKGLLKCPQIDFDGPTNLVGMSWEDMSSNYMTGQLLLTAYQNIFTIEKFLDIKLSFLKISPGDIFQYYKNGEYYKIIAVGKNTETLEDIIVYKSIYDENVWVKPRRLFLEYILYDDQLTKRFTKIS